MFGSKKSKDTRFFIKSDENIPSLGRITILVDRKTGVNYLHSWVGAGSSMTPLLNEKGDVIIDQQ